MGEARAAVESGSEALQAWRTRMVNLLLAVLAMAALPPVAMMVVQATGDPNRVPGTAVLVGCYLVLVAMAALRRLEAQVRAWVALLIGYLAAAVGLARAGLLGDGRVYLLSLPVLAMILIGVRSGLIMTALSLVMMGIYTLFAYWGWLEGWLVYEESLTAGADWLEAWFNVLMFLAPISLLLWRFIDFQRETLAGERRAAQELAKASDLLRQRAAELEEANRRQAERQRVLATVAGVSRAVASIREPEALCREVVEYIQEKFELYYVGLFGLDEEGRYAVLEAGSGEAGRRMRAEDFRLEVGGRSLVGTACAEGRTKVMEAAAGQTRMEALLDYPLLPRSRSEVAVPLMVGSGGIARPYDGDGAGMGIGNRRAVGTGRLLGVLDVHSTGSEAFSEEEIAALKLVADQIAVGLENARLFAQTQSNLRELSGLYRATTAETWQRFAETQSHLSCYQLGGTEVTAETWQGVFTQAWDRERPTAVRVQVDSSTGEGEEERHALAIPIRYRGVPIGVVGIHRPLGAGDWQDEEIVLGENLAERMALALENARLLEETQRRATREQLTREVTDRIRGAVTVEDAIRRAVEEMGRALGASEVLVRVGTEEDLVPAGGPEGDGDG